MKSFELKHKLLAVFIYSGILGFGSEAFSQATEPVFKSLLDRSLPSEKVIYRVKGNEALGAMIYKLYPGYGTPEKRIYGPTGKLAEILKLNPALGTDGALIKGMDLVLPREGLSMEAFAEFSKKNVSEKMIPKTEEKAPELVKQKTHETPRGDLIPYTVRGGESLLSIINKFYPEYGKKKGKRIYGPEGKLRELLLLNPQLNPDEKLVKGQVINLSPEDYGTSSTDAGAVVVPDQASENNEAKAQTPQAPPEKYLPVERLNYKVKGNEVLGVMIQKLYPGYGTREKRIYGPRGKLAEILKLNPSLGADGALVKGMDLALPREGLSLEAFEEFTKNEVLAKVTPEADGQAPETVEQKTPNTPREDLIPYTTPPSSQAGSTADTESEQDRWGLSPYFGIKYISIGQTGALGSVDISGTFPLVVINSTLQADDLLIGLEAGTYSFKYNSLQGVKDDRFYSTRIYGSMNNFNMGLYLEQLPLMRNNNGVLEMVRQNTYFAKIGYGREKKIRSKKKETSFIWDTNFSLPFYASTNSDQTKVKSISGYGIHAKGEFRRLMFSYKDDMKLYASWLTLIDFYQTSTDVKWDRSLGNTKTRIVEVSSLLGFTGDF